MIKCENRDDSSEEEQYILPDLCNPAGKLANSQIDKSEEIYEGPCVQFIKTECPDYSSDDDNYILPDQYEAAADGAQVSLPEKSKKLYKESYLQFLKWLEEKEIKSISENILLEYFKGLSTKMSAVSLWPKYSMLRAMINQEKNIDIKSYTQLRLFLKKQNTGVRCKAIKSFTSEEMKRFLTEAPDEQCLDLKVIMIIGVAGACRRKELHDLRINQVTDENGQLVIMFPDIRTHIMKTFVLTNSLRDIVIQYINLRPTDVEDDHFFMNYQKGKCTKQLIGINKIGGIPHRIATWLNLPSSNLYTGHSFRKTSASSLADAGASIDALRQHGEALSLSFEIDESVKQSITKKSTRNEIMEGLDDEQSCDSAEPVEDTLPKKSKKLYKETYFQFSKWMEEKEKKSYSEVVLLEYFSELATKMSPVSLWPKYSMLRAMINQEKNIDIKGYAQLRSFLKKLNIGVRCKKAKTFTSEEIKRFLTEAPDEESLDLKVVMIIGIAGSCRRRELHNLRISHVKDVNNQLIVMFPDAKTRAMRTFTVNNSLRDIVMKYINLRPKDAEDDHFFLNYQKGKCTKQLIGINKIGGIPHKIASWLNLPSPNLYTGHSFRRASALVLADIVV